MSISPDKHLDFSPFLFFLRKFFLRNVLPMMLTLASFFSFAGTNTNDSLLLVLKNQKEDSAKILTLLVIAEKYYYQNPDSSILYSIRAKQLSEKLNDRERLAMSFISLGWEYYLLGNFPEALRNCYEALKIIDELEKPSNAISAETRMRLMNIKAQATGNAGNVYWDQGDYQKALEHYTKALDLAEKCGIKNEKARHQVSIGNTYLYQALLTDIERDEKKRLFRLALEYFFKALGGFEEIGNNNGIGVILGNIGMVYGEIGKANIRDKEFNYEGDSVIPSDRDSLFSKALYFTLKAFRMAEELGNRNGMAMQMGNLGSLYFNIGKFKESEIYLKRALSLSDSIGDLVGTKEVNQNLSSLYDTLATASALPPNKKIEYLRLSSLHFKKFIEARDTLESEDRERQSIRSEMNYEYEKKEAVTKAEHEKQMAVAEADSKRQKVIIFSVAGGLLLVLVFAGIIFRSLRITTMQKQLIEIQKTRVEQQKDEIKKQKEIVEEKNKLVELQKKQIEEKHKETTDSITYARRLQLAILPPAELIKKQLPGIFIFYRPKDIVAGDFYWYHSISDTHTELLFIAAADCTGHGVPGAMVSVVCSNALNRAVKEFNLKDTGLILDKVTDLVLETFEKSSTDVKDGMDISLLKIEFDISQAGKTVKRIDWSGANNPLWYFRDGQIKEVKANKQPVGKYDNRKPFTTNQIGYDGPAVFYLFTDGFPDQFGGPKGKKFLYKRFEENLSSICNLPMEEQAQIIGDIFNDWKGPLEQVDDVTVLGIRV